MQKRIIIIVIILLVLTTAFIALYTYFKPKIANENENVNQTNMNVVNTNENNNQNQNQNVNKTEETTDKETITSISLAYAERYGSFSNQNNFENLEDLRIWMTKSLQKITDDYIAQERTKNINSAVYHGFTTTSLTSNINLMSSSQATVTVSARRQEADSNTNQSKTYYQDLVLKFVKEDGNWKVNEATWQNIK